MSVPVSPFKQPRAVYAVAFACVVSFMGIGLVDPILPALAEQLDASRSQVSLLFTSYLVVTAVAMLGTGWVSSRVGAKRTLIGGLALIVAFALALDAADRQLAGHGAEPEEGAEGLESVGGGDTTGEELVRR